MDNQINFCDYEKFQQLLLIICDQIEANIDLLNELDSAIGDGDLGITLHRGFQAIRRTAQKRYKTIGQLLVFSGMDFSNSACSTMGMLFGMAVLSAGVSVIEKDDIDLAASINMVNNAIRVIEEKGGAKVGDKTMLDTLVPISLSLQASLDNNLPIPIVVKNVYLASVAGCEGTRNLEARKGRASWLGYQTIGHLDPGAVFINLIMKAIYETVIKE